MFAGKVGGTERQHLGLSIFLTPIMTHLQCKECCSSPDHAEQLSKKGEHCISFPPVLLMNTAEVVRATWLRLDKGWHEGRRRSSHKNLCTFYTTWSIAEQLSANIWTRVTNLSASTVLKREITVLFRAAVVTGIMQLLQLVGHKVQLSYPGCNEIWQLVPHSGRQSTTPRRLLC